MQDAGNEPNIQIKKAPNTLLVVLLSVGITALVVGGGVYWWQQKKPQPTSYPALENQLTTQTPLPSGLPSPEADTNVTKGYKSVGVGVPYLSFEVPEDWSVTLNPESVGIVGTNKLPDFPMLSVGQTDVAYGDTNWSQVDFYYSQDDIIDQLIKDNEGFEPSDGETTEKVAGLPARVFTYSLDGGQVTKAGTGGKSYYIRLPQNPYGTKTLYIHKQALGDEEFEAGFQHLLQSMNIQSQ